MNIARRLVSFALAATLFAPAVAGARSWATPPPSEAPPPVTELEMAPEPVAMPSRAAVRTALAANRTANLARFHAYREGGVYPHNVVALGRFADGPRASANIWLDGDGHFCAAATMIRGSGAVALVDRVAVDDNFVHLADVTAGPLLDWMLTSGLTQEEVALIQEPFMEVDRQAEVLAEDRRLAARYVVVERQVKRQARASLTVATDRLMAYPALAAALVAGT